jgi:hypothetical protein
VQFCLEEKAADCLFDFWVDPNYAASAACQISQGAGDGSPDVIGVSPE